MFPNADADTENLLPAVMEMIRRWMGMAGSGGAANAGLSSPETALLKVCRRRLVQICGCHCTFVFQRRRVGTIACEVWNTSPMSVECYVGDIITFLSRTIRSRDPLLSFTLGGVLRTCMLFLHEFSKNILCSFIFCIIAPIFSTYYICERSVVPARR